MCFRASGDQLFDEKKIVARSPGNVLISILTLSDRQTEPFGAHFGPFSFLYNFFFYLAGISSPPTTLRGSSEVCNSKSPTPLSRPAAGGHFGGTLPHPPPIHK